VSPLSTIKITSEFNNVSVTMGVVDGLALHGGLVDTRLATVTLSGRGARVYTCICVRDNIPCRRLPK